MGNFDFDKAKKKPIFLKNKHGQYTDKNYRVVNQFGFLINEEEHIIDNEGEIKLMSNMLQSNSDMPLLFNFRAKKFKI